MRRNAKKSGEGAGGEAIEEVADEVDGGENQGSELGYSCQKQHCELMVL